MHAPVAAKGCQRQCDRHLAHLLDQLADGCGQHMPSALQIAAVSAHHAYEEQTGRDAQIARRCHRRSLNAGNYRRKRHQQHGCDQTQHRQHPQCHAEDLPGVRLLIPGHVMADHTGNRHRNACGGNGQKQIIGRKNLVIHSHTHRPDQRCQGNAVKHAHHFANQPCGAQNADAAHQRFSGIFYSVLICH